MNTNANTATSIDAQVMRSFAGHFASGVTVLTTIDAAGRLYGLTMNAVSCVCLEPPLFLACVDKNSATLGPLLESNVFALNILAADQDKISNNFASKGEDKFANVATTTGSLGVPLITGALAAAEFRLFNRFEAGDHVIVIGEAIATTTSDAAPLLYFKGKYGALRD